MADDYHKYRHVQGAKIDPTRDHTCHWPNCRLQVPPAMWGCKTHWLTLPKPIRDAIWQAYTIGQESDPALVSEEYLTAASRAQSWIRTYLAASIHRPAEGER